MQGFCFGLVGANLATRVRTLFLQAVLRMEVAWFDMDANTSGALTSRLATDAPAVRGAVADVLGIVMSDVSTMVFGYIIAFLNGWKMTLIVTAALPLLVFSSFVHMHFMTRAHWLSFTEHLWRQFHRFQYIKYQFCLSSHRRSWPLLVPVFYLPVESHHCVEFVKCLFGQPTDSMGVPSRQAG